jgi:hypothetical protein
MNWQRTLSIQSRAAERVSSRFSPCRLEANGSPHRAIPLCNPRPVSTVGTRVRLKLAFPCHFKCGLGSPLTSRRFSRPWTRGARRSPNLSSVGGCLLHHRRRSENLVTILPGCASFCRCIYSFMPTFSPTLLLAGPGINEATSVTHWRIACLSCSSSCWRISRDIVDDQPHLCATPNAGLATRV